jgi:hypothetical protein
VIVEDLGVDEPGAVTERQVDVPAADLAVVVDTAPLETPSATSGDPGGLLHIDVDRLPGRSR